ncbi:hypothetical protein [Colwellia sp. MEBiC06753]
MSTFDQELKWRIANAESVMVVVEAPKVAEDIWRKHQIKQLSIFVAVVAFCTAFLLSAWFYNLSQSPFEMPDYIIQSHQYEKQLAKFADVQLSATHSAIMANWYHELSVIDQTLERGKGNLYNMELWQQRTELLKTMVEFYTKPTDLYEI